MTGVSILTASLEAKRVELLHELIPNAAVIAALVNPTFSEAESQLQVVQAAANKLGRQIRVLNASSEGEIDSAFADLIQHHVDALLVTSDPFFFAVREKLIALAARHAVPMIAFIREFTVAGVWHTSFRRVPSNGRLFRPDPQRRQAGRPADRAAHQI